MDIRSAGDDPADLWENITPLSPAEFAPRRPRCRCTLVPYDLQPALPEPPGNEIRWTPFGYQGAAQHTYTAACDGFHEPGPCPLPATSDVRLSGSEQSGV